MLLVAFALISLVYVQIGAKAKSVADEVVSRSLTQSNNIMNTRVASRYLFIQEVAKGLASDARIRPLVYEQASLTLQDLSEEYQAVYEFDSLIFLNSAGIVIARSDQPDAIGVDLSGRTSLFDDALNGQLSRGFFSSKGKLMQTVVTPIFDNVATDLVKGAVVLAYELSPLMAQEIFELTQSHIGFFTFTRELVNNEVQITGVQASYITDAALGEALEHYFTSDETLWRSVIASQGEGVQADLFFPPHIESHLHIWLKPILSNDGLPLGLVISLRSDAQLRAPFDTLRQSILVDGAISLLFASVLALLIAISISRPIIRLVEVVKRIQNGIYSDKDKQLVAKDEVGTLHNAIIQMSNSLQEKAELEAYLAGLADEVVDNSAFLALPESPVSALTQDIDETMIQLPTASNESLIDGRFKLLSDIGEGSMGKVYLAEDLELNDKLAIKVLDPKLCASFEGFNVKEEIRLARKITHRNVVRTFDFGNWNNSIYITMEYVEGYDLGKLLKRKGALEFNIGLALCKQICSAMMSAHQLGIVHRDLKPANMIINRQGVVKIMDFGLAMQVQGQNQTFSQTDSYAGSYLAGTPRFMAPEQFSINAELDERTDIYSIGVIMFTLFNGEPPFKGKNLKDIADLHQNAPIPPFDKARRSIPSELVSVIKKAMEKQPKARFQSVKEMYEALTAVN